MTINVSTAWRTALLAARACPCYRRARGRRDGDMLMRQTVNRAWRGDVTTEGKLMVMKQIGENVVMA